MTHIRRGRTSRQRRRAGTTLVLAAASGGLLAAAMAGSPTARADDLTDIVNDVHASISAGEADYTAAGTDFSTGGTTADGEGLINLLAGFDNTFVSPGDYVLVGLTGEATGTDISGLAGDFDIGGYSGQPLTEAGQDAIAASDASSGATELADAASYFSSGDYTDAALYYASGTYLTDILAPEADLLGSLFGAGF